MDQMELLEHLIDSSSHIYAKTLSKNDYSWAVNPNIHQGGFYIPAMVRQSGFFPELLSRSDKPHIFDSVLNTKWLQINEAKESRLVWYSNKGPETHLTKVPHDLFKDLSPASMVLIGKSIEINNVYNCLIVDSSSEEYLDVIERLGLSPLFHSELIDVKKYENESRDLESDILQAILTGELDDFIHDSIIPSSQELSLLAQEAVMSSHDIVNFNPFSSESPGNIISDLVEVEYKIYQEKELRLRSAQIAKLLYPLRQPDGIASVAKMSTQGFSGLSEIFKSIRGARASRAGAALENHLSRMLSDGLIPFEDQVLLDNNKKPDFILPSASVYNQIGTSRKPSDVIVLTAKTTVKERWKQILSEGRKVNKWYLMTLDRTIGDRKLREMESEGVVLVVPENHKKSKETIYEKYSNVVSLEYFFQEIVSPNMKIW